MKIENMSLEKIREIGLDALEKALGPVGMARFLMQFEKGGWGYTKLILADMVPELFNWGTQVNRKDTTPLVQNGTPAAFFKNPENHQFLWD